MLQTCLYNISHKKNYWIFTTTSHYRGYLTVVQHKTKFATVQSRVTVVAAKWSTSTVQMPKNSVDIALTTIFKKLKLVGNSQSNPMLMLAAINFVKT